MQWISVDKLLPGERIEWVIVRCVNIDLTDFYFMASYCHGSSSWEYFDDDKNYDETMRVTHWLIPEEVIEKDYFIDSEGKKITEPNI